MAGGLGGKPAKTTTTPQDPLRPAGYEWAQDFYKYAMPILMQAQMPQFPGFTFGGKPWGAGYPTPTPMTMGQARGLPQRPELPAPPNPGPGGVQADVPETDWPYYGGGG